MSDEDDDELVRDAARRLQAPERLTYGVKLEEAQLAMEKFRQAMNRSMGPSITNLAIAIAKLGRKGKMKWH